jgi:hypothetical protein
MMCQIWYIVTVLCNMSFGDGVVCDVCVVCVWCVCGVCVVCVWCV